MKCEFMKALTIAIPRLNQCSGWAGRQKVALNFLNQLMQSQMRAGE